MALHGPHHVAQKSTSNGRPSSLQVPVEAGGGQIDGAALEQRLATFAAFRGRRRALARHRFTAAQAGQTKWKSVGDRCIRMNAVELQMGIAAGNTPRCILRTIPLVGRTLWPGAPPPPAGEENHAVSRFVTLGEILVEIMATEPRPRVSRARHAGRAHTRAARRPSSSTRWRELGQPAALIGCVGDDDFGRAQHRAAARAMASTSRRSRSIRTRRPAAPSSRYRADGDRDFVFNIAQSPRATSSTGRGRRAARTRRPFPCHGLVAVLDRG